MTYHTEHFSQEDVEVWQSEPIEVRSLLAESSMWWCRGANDWQSHSYVTSRRHDPEHPLDDSRDVTERHCRHCGRTDRAIVEEELRWRGQPDTYWDSGRRLRVWMIHGVPSLNPLE